MEMKGSLARQKLMEIMKFWVMILLRYRGSFSRWIGSVKRRGHTE